MHGVLLIDKPLHWTSHDVVARVRKIVNRRQVGHAGTLDPLASGLLMIGVGEGTKLLAYLQDDNKQYTVSIALGSETDTLDREGAITQRARVPDSLSTKKIQHVTDQFLGLHT